jgi:hypothetical protein
MAHDVFISYAAEDKLTADAACAILERNRLRVWIAPRDVVPGSAWAESVVDAIKSSRVMVLVFSDSANKSMYVNRELDRAVHHGISILQLRIEDTPPSRSLEFYTSGQHWLDALTPPMERHLERLAENIHQLLGSQAKREGKSSAPPAAARAASASLLPWLDNTTLKHIAEQAQPDPLLWSQRHDPTCPSEFYRGYATLISRLSDALRPEPTVFALVPLIDAFDAAVRDLPADDRTQGATFALMNAASYANGGDAPLVFEVLEREQPCIAQCFAVSQGQGL